MRYAASEKLEIIRLVEQSHLPVKRTLDKIGISRAKFYRWYDSTAGSARRAWRIVAQAHTGHGTAFRTKCGVRSSTWRWSDRSLARVNSL